MGADTAAYSELLAIIKRHGGGLRAEALVEKLMQEIGELRGVIAAEKSDSKRLKVLISTYKEQHPAPNIGVIPQTMCLEKSVQDLGFKHPWIFSTVTYLHL